MSIPFPAFAYGRFLGDYRAQREVGQMALAELRPTVPEHEVHEHTHEDAHFLLLLQGNYLSSAHGMPPVCSTRALVLNPPGTYLRRCRMERAIDLLDDAGLSVAEVAASCGFADQAHFTHTFRRAHRLTPSQYRALG